MPNILTAILNITKFSNNDLKDYSTRYLNRINAVGEQLEFYMKDAITNSFTKDQNQKERTYSTVFSYLGNQNNPPDIIIKDGDAFEIKKIEGENSTIALNSSPPKNKLYSSDPRITAECRKCEKVIWKEKNLFYVVGCVKDKNIKYLFLVDGACYAADKEVYDKIHSPLKREIGKILSSSGLESGDTIELGKVKRADPLGITELRIRGMWGMQNPIKVFSSFINYDENKKFSLFSIMLRDKYNSFPKSDIKAIESNKNISVKDIKTKKTLI